MMNYFKTKKHSVPSWKPKSGSSIVEVLIALSLFAMFISGACKVIVSHRQLSDKSRGHYTAINLAKNRVERVRNMRRADYDQIFAMRELGTVVNADGDPQSTGKFKRTTTISTTDVNDLLEIEVKIFIKNQVSMQFEQERESVSSYMAKLNKR